MYCIDDLAKDMTALEFGEFGLGFDTFEEIVRGTTDHERGCCTTMEGSAGRDIGCIDIRGEDFFIPDDRLFAKGI
jgi:hypothetical protein